MKKFKLSDATEWIYDQAFSPIVIVTTQDHQHNRPNGMTCGWSMPCSGEPLMYAISLWKQGYSHHLVRKNQSFAVNIPNKLHLDLVKNFGATHGNKIDKFKKFFVKYELVSELKVPILTDVSASYVCKVINEVDCGDHYIFIGQVVEAYIDPQKRTLVNIGKTKEKSRYYEI